MRKAGINNIPAFNYLSERKLMARKDFEEYYKKIRDQYFQMLNALEEAGNLAIKNMIDPQVLENLNSTVQPIKNSYMSLAYVEYLLNLPKDKKIQKRNERQFKAALEKIDSSQRKDIIINNNQKAISSIQDVINEELK